MKNISMKSFFLILLSFCLFGFGTLSFANNTKRLADAATQTVENVQNLNSGVPEFFEVKEYTAGGQEASSSLIDDNIFLFNPTSQNYLDLRFKLNGEETLVDDDGIFYGTDVYKYVYYPNAEDLSTFSYFIFSSLTFTINGATQSYISGDSYRFHDSNESIKFSVMSDAPETIAVRFNSNGIQDSSWIQDKTNAIKLLNNQNNVIEGLYSLTFTYIQYICTQEVDSQSDLVFNGQEALDTFRSVTDSFTYNFIVLNENNYVSNSRPIMSQANFSSQIDIADSISSMYGYYLYSNYSTNDNKIPSISYDPTKYDITITKLLGTNPAETTKIVYNVENDSYTTTGDEIIYHSSAKRIVGGSEKIFSNIYFYDVGNYSVTFNAVATFQNGTEYKNYKLAPITNSMRHAMVYMFGYQLSYLDKDKPGTTYTEFKINNFTGATPRYEDSADITSGFLDSNSDYVQNYPSEIERLGQKQEGVFSPSNILNYINTNNIAPVTTNQSSLRFTSNAKLSEVATSTVYCTTRIDSSANEYIGGSLKLNGENKTLYSYTYTGARTIKDDGTYLVILAYTFSNYFNAPTSSDTGNLFYQVFYFTINNETPTLNAQTASGTPVPAYTNQDVTILNKYILNVHNKDLTIRVYAQKFDGSYDTSFGEYQGKNFEDLSTYDMTTEGGVARFSANAHYTIRVFYSYTINPRTFDFDIRNQVSPELIKREINFTIDKLKVNGIGARAVAASTTTANYTIMYSISPMTPGSAITTNQNIVVSWNEKASKASTFASFRYFPIVPYEFYSSSLSEEELSIKLGSYLEYDINQSYLPINYKLDLSSDTILWENYPGNTLSMTYTVSSNYVLKTSAPGLYLFDIYDVAGNHSYQIFIVDTTTPIFATHTGTTYGLASSYLYIDNNTEIIWSDYKSITISGVSSTSSIAFNGPVFDSNTGNLKEDLDVSAEGLYRDRYGNANFDIYKAFYYQLYTVGTNPNPLWHYLSINDNNLAYLTINIGNEYCYYNNSSNNNFYKIYPDETTGNVNFVNKITFDTSTEYTFRLLIRDSSNTKVDPSISNPVNKYTSYYSAMQVVIVSHDSASLRLYYGDENNPVYLTGKTAESFDTTNNKKTLVTYIDPVNVSESIKLSYIPTPSQNGEYIIQLDNITVDYYATKDDSHTIGDISYFYKTFVDSQKVQGNKIYEFKNGQHEATTQVANLDENAITENGIYIIKRTYFVGSQGGNTYNYNDEDYYTRIYVLIVDRFNVIEGAKTINDNGDKHAESLVGGEIFVSMYDTMHDSNLVVTFPDAPFGNRTNTSLVGGTFATNKLPISIMIPAYKYTKYVELVGTETYNYHLENNNYAIISTNNNLGATTSTYTLTSIESYLLFAEIYKEYGTENQQLLYRTSTKFNDPSLPNIQGAIATTGAKVGYLNFYDSSNNLVSNIITNGTYTVMIYQAYNKVAESDGSTFKKCSTFTFTIKKVNPDFSLSETGGTALNSPDGFNYYTNKNSIRVSWDMANDDYTAEIDQDYVSVSINGVNQNTITNLNRLFSYTITPNNTAKIYTATLNFTDIDGRNIYQNGSYIDITMRYKNHNSAYYDDEFKNGVHKRIIIDTEAPSTNITNLVQNVVANSGGFIKEEDLRVYSGVYGSGDENTFTSNDLNWRQKTCYNTSCLKGNFRYFSYAVTSSYVTTLLNSEADNVYFKQLSADYKYGTAGFETDPNEFSPSNGFTLLTNTSEFEIGKYYEIVESDIAGNLSIYTIYFIDELIEGQLEDYTIIDYTVNDLTEKEESGRVYDFNRSDYIEARSKGVTPTIYTAPGLKLTAINYLKNTWYIFSATTTSLSGIQGVTTYYLVSPWITSGYAYRFADGQTVMLTTILNGNTDDNHKDYLTFYNMFYQTPARTSNIYFNTRTYIITSSTSTSGVEDIIFTQPTINDLNNANTAYPFLTKLKVYLPDVEDGAIGSLSNPFYNVTNKLGLAELWASEDYPLIMTSTTGGRTIFRLATQLANDTKIIYEYVDNYGNAYREIHLFNETYIQNPISSENTLYSFNFNAGDGIEQYYITEDGFRYTYNSKKYYVITYQRNGIGAGGTWDFLRTTSTDVSTTSDNTTASIRVNTYNIVDKSKSYTFLLRLDVYDLDDIELATGTTVEGALPIRQVYFILNNNVPKIETTNTASLDNSFKFTSSGLNVTASILGLNDQGMQDSSLRVNYYSSVYLNYNISSSNLLPIAFSLSTNGIDWTDISNGSEITALEGEESTTYKLRVWYDMFALANLGYRNTYQNDYSFIFGYIPSYQIYTFTLSSALSTAYYVTFEDSTGASRVINRSGETYTARLNANMTRQFANHYIINTSFENKDYVTIVTNTEQYITAVENNGYFDDGNGVRTYTYTISNIDAIQNIANISRFSTTIAITFVPPTNQIVSTFYTTSLNTGTINRNYNLVSLGTPKHEVIVTSGSNRDSVEIRWNRYYAITQNAINLIISKNGIALTPTLFTDGDEYYTYITRSGLYSISFEDVAGNRQVFCLNTSNQTENFTYVFIKDIAFYLTYTNPLTEEEQTTEPVKQAVYNGSVKLTIDTTLINYYLNKNITLEVIKDGVEGYTGYEIDTTVRSYTFNEVGYYSVTFSAYSNVDENIMIRSETYTFTILDPGEFRSSYIVNKYSNYYVQRVVKDGVDVTDLYIATLGLETIVVNSTPHLAELTLSYLNEKTGAGSYYITVNSNELLYSSDSLMTSWTFRINIKVGNLKLIRCSVEPGGETTKAIEVTFNCKNIFEEFGRCTVRAVYYDGRNQMQIAYEKVIDENETEVETQSLIQSQVYFIQIVAPSGNLLDSFKVIKNDPFNAATIIIIVVAVVLAITVIVLVVLLRKRISIK